MTKPGTLDGIRVLDFTTMMAGPYCTRMLADCGAEVIKIEAPEGDYMRARVPLRDGHSTYYGQLNAGKKSVVMDLKQPAARQAVLDLVKQSDVVVENFRPGVMKRLGFDYPTLSAINPRLVFCAISGFGQTGAWSQRSAYAPVVHAAAGYDLSMLEYQEGIERPLRTGVHIADIVGAYLGVAGINAALVRALRTGQGDFVDVSLMDTMLGMMPYELQMAQFPMKHSRALFQPTRARDGYILIAPVSQNVFELMCRAMGHPEWIADPRFSNTSENKHLGSNREQNWATLMQLLDDWAADKSAQECEDVLVAGGVPCSRYFTIGEAMQLGPIVERGTFETIDDGAGPFKVPNPAFRYTNTEARARNYVAGLGADGEATLGALLGYTPEQVAALRG